MTRKSKKLLLGLGSLGLVATIIFLYLQAQDVGELPLPRWADAERNGGFICTGYRPDFSFWDITDKPCPDGYGLYSADDPGGPQLENDGSDVPIIGLCCRLPFADVLTDQHFYNVMDTCPENSVVTSATETTCGSSCGMRCTRINTDKYKLGPPLKGVYWHRMWEVVHTGWGGADRIRWESIPAGIRYSVGRRKQYLWDVDGCVGYPFGSVLTGKKKKSCDSLYFRELLYADGTPVPMFPVCPKLDNPASPKAKCLETDSTAKEPSP